MPKKTPRNAFYFYMQHFKEEQRQKGINYPNMAAVAEAAGPIWKDAPPPVRAKFESMAKAEKQKNNVPEKKFTSTGIPLSEIERQERERREAMEAERADIANFVKQKSINESILDEDIYFIDVNAYCKTGVEYFFGEMTILRFSLQTGIKDSYHELINPGGIPIGYANDVKIGCKELGLLVPDDQARVTNYTHVLANLIDYLKKAERSSKCLPPIFTTTDKVVQVVNFIQQLCRRAAEDDSLFRVYKLESLFFMLTEAVSARREDVFPESLAADQVKRDLFMFNPGLGCKHHEQNDKSIECTTSRAKRWAFTVMDTCCKRAGVNFVPGRHLPEDVDLDSVVAARESFNAWSNPRVAGDYFDSSLDDTRESTHNATAVNVSSHSIASDFSASRAEKKAHVHVPMRAPNIDYSQKIRAPPNLDSAQDFPDFPKLGETRKGRGRGLAASLNNMKM